MTPPARVLLALDGSQQSAAAARYVSCVFAKNSEIVLFHVVPETPEAFRDLAEDPLIYATDLPLRAWVDHQKRNISEFMEATHRLFVKAGFSRQAVSVRIQNLGTGITRDIINALREGFDTVVIGRNGIGKLDERMMGSVSAKLVEVCALIPVIVVGGKPDHNSVLIAFDGSQGCMKAVDTVGCLLDPDDCRVLLCHVVRTLSLQQRTPDQLFVPQHENHWIEAHQRKLIPTFNEAKKRLLDAGIPEDRILQDILTRQMSRADAIFKQAETGGYNGIAAGRRGLTSVEEFQLGRVSRKLLYLADDKALWLAS
jgi:nucleotide-binding universal stress UspA family protein